MVLRQNIHTMITLYHSSPVPFSHVKPIGYQTEYVDFGGIFALTDPEGSIDHGSFLHRIELDESEVLTQFIINTEVSSDFIESVLRKNLRIETDEDLKLASHISEFDRNLFELSENEIERLCHVFRVEQTELAWLGQRVRGQIAAAAGYKAVEMTDEHGRSYLVLPGVEVALINALEEEPLALPSVSSVTAPLTAGGRRQRRSAANEAVEVEVVQAQDSRASDDFLASIAPQETAQSAERDDNGLAQ